MGHKNRKHQPSQPSPSTEPGLREFLAAVRALEQPNRSRFNPPLTGTGSPRVHRPTVDQSSPLTNGPTDSGIWQDKYEESRYELMESRLNEKNTASLGSFRDETRKDLSDFKGQILMWFVGTILTIVLGLIAFHFASLATVDDNVKKKFESLSSETSENIKKQLQPLSDRLETIERNLSKGQK